MSIPVMDRLIIISYIVVKTGVKKAHLKQY